MDVRNLFSKLIGFFKPELRFVDEFTMPARTEWIKFNVNQTGFYRVHYQGKLWENLVKTLLSNPFVLTPTDRASLIDDAFTLCKYGLFDKFIQKKTKIC